MATLGPFKRISKTTAYGLVCVIVPASLAASTHINAPAEFEIDWGDGVFVSYAANAHPFVTPTGTITLRSVTASTFRIYNNALTVDLQVATTITSLDSSFAGLIQMTTATWADIDACTTAVLVFSGCSSLTSFTFGSMSSLTNFAGFFSNCDALTATVNLDLSNALNIQGMYGSCNALVSAGDITAPLATDASFLFVGCTSLVSVGVITAPSLTTAVSMFHNCRKLRCIGGLDTSMISGTALKANLFQDCRNLHHPCPQVFGGASETDPLVSSAGSSYTNGSPVDCADFHSTGQYFGKLVGHTIDEDFLQDMTKFDDPGTPPTLSQIVFAWEDQAFDLGPRVFFGTSGGLSLWMWEVLGGLPSGSECYLSYYDLPDGGQFYITSTIALLIADDLKSQLGTQGCKVV